MQREPIDTRFRDCIAEIKELVFLIAPTGDRVFSAVRIFVWATNRVFFFFYFNWGCGEW